MSRNTREINTLKHSGILSLRRNCYVETNRLILSTSSIQSTKYTSYFLPTLSSKVRSLISPTVIENLKKYYVPQLKLRYINKHNIHKLLHGSITVDQLNEQHIEKSIVVKTVIDFFPAIIFSAITLIIFIMISLIFRYINAKKVQEVTFRSRPVSIMDLSFL